MRPQKGFDVLFHIELMLDGESFAHAVNMRGQSLGKCLRVYQVVFHGVFGWVSDDRKEGGGD